VAALRPARDHAQKETRHASEQERPDILKLRYAWFNGLSVTVARVMTDNGVCYKSHAFRDTCAAMSLRHIRTEPCTPKTNGKAERFIQTVLREWAYEQAYQTSDYRTAELPVWLYRYNWHRPQGGIKSRTPISRPGLDADNRLRSLLSHMRIDQSVCRRLSEVRRRHDQRMLIFSPCNLLLAGRFAE
jgi:transposase InsO family protein